MKKVLAVCLAAVLCLFLFPMSALAADSDFVIKNGELTSYQGSGGHVVIPDGVTTIGAFAFRDCESLTGVTIPDTVTQINISAFYHCTNLTSVTIPNSVKGNSLGSGAFASCTSLTSVTLPNSITSLGSETFKNCTSLTSIKIPDTVTTIGGSAFQNCESLTSITIPDSVKMIGEYAFDGCTNLTSVTLGNGLKGISGNMFRDCEKLTSITIPDSIISIQGCAFQRCASLTDITIGNIVDLGVDSHIGVWAFDGCTSLTSITIPENVTNIHDDAFRDCEGFTIYGSEGSHAQTYAKSHNIPFVAIASTTTAPSEPTEPTTPATTVPPSDWAEEQVNAAITANLVPQNLQSAYTQATTRAEFAALAVTLYEQVTGTTITERQTFSDTSDINVEKAAAIGVVSGIGDNQFAPDSPLTREQAATMLSRLADAIGKPLTKAAATFADNNSVSSWAIEAVGQMQATGIMGGVGDNTFAPASDYTREQSIVTVLRLYDVLQSDTSGTNNTAPASDVLNGTYQWTGMNNYGANMMYTLEFKNDNTVVFTSADITFNYTVSTETTYQFDGDQLVISSFGTPLKVISVDYVNHTITCQMDTVSDDPLVFTKV